MWSTCRNDPVMIPLRMHSHQLTIAFRLEYISPVSNCEFRSIHHAFRSRSIRGLGLIDKKTTGCFTMGGDEVQSVQKALGFIGAGQMAEALARGFASKKISSVDKMFCTDVSKARKEVFEEFGITVCTSSKEVVEKARIIFIAVKPQYVKVVLSEVKSLLTPDHVIVSIAAGVPLSTLAEAAGDDAHLIRVMPNTPCLVGESASAMCLGGKATDADGDDVQALFAAVGKMFRVDEKLLSAVTGLSGSGPAYIFVVIEAMADGGVRAGLPRDIAQQLAAQTVLGAAKMVLETGRHPGMLKDMVTSPAGTTIAGVYELEKAGVRQAFMTAVGCAADRADELAAPQPTSHL